MSRTLPLRLTLAPSYRLAAVIAGVHLAAGASLFAALGGATGAALSVLVLALGAAAAWDRALLRGRRAPRMVAISTDGSAEIEFSGAMRCAVAEGPRHVSRFWVALPVRMPARRTVLVAADMLAPAEFRLLRLWALWGRVPGVASGQLPA